MPCTAVAHRADPQTHRGGDHDHPTGGEGKYLITMMCTHDHFVLPWYILMPKLNSKKNRNVFHAPPHPHPQGGRGSITMARGGERGEPIFDLKAAKPAIRGD